MQKKIPNYPIKILNKTLIILEAFLNGKSDFLSIRELSEKLGIFPSTIHRILDNLLYWGYIEHDPITKKYTLGLKTVKLGMAKLNNISVVKEANPYLKELVNECNETVHLGVIKDGEIFNLFMKESDQSIRMTSQLGRKFPIYATSLGKVFLAFLSSIERDNILNTLKFQKLTKDTIDNIQDLEKELKKIKKQGFAINNGETEKGIYCIAAPILNYHGNIIAAISICGPFYRINKKKRVVLKNLVIETSKKISNRLEYISL